MINKDIKIDIPGPVREILGRLNDSGFEAYIVGGCVRDALLGREPKDWDITTSALPMEVKSLFHNTVDTGIQHGTVMVIKNGEGYEVTTYRVDGEYKDGRHPSSVTFTRSLAEDLKRRDFTINAFAWDEAGLIDMFDGLSDLNNRIIRCVGNPDERFNEDALRIMRAVRFSAQLGFEIEAKTRDMISKYKERLADISRERIRVEFEKTLLSGCPDIVNEYRTLGLAPYIVGSGWEKCFDSERNALYAEILRRKELKKEDELFTDDVQEFYRLLTMAAFFSNLTAKEADQAFRSLKYDNRSREAVRKILENKDNQIPADRSAVKKELNRTGKDTVMAVLEYRDIAVHVGSADAEEKQRITEALRQFRNEVSDVLRSMEAWSISQLAVNGRDLIAAGIPAGKELGEILGKILQEVIGRPCLNTKDQLLDPEFLERIRNMES